MVPRKLKKQYDSHWVYAGHRILIWGVLVFLVFLLVALPWFISSLSSSKTTWFIRIYGDMFLIISLVLAIYLIIFSDYHGLRHEHLSLHPILVQNNQLVLYQFWLVFFFKKVAIPLSSISELSKEEVSPPEWYGNLKLVVKLKNRDVIKSGVVDDRVYKWVYRQIYPGREYIEKKLSRE